MLWERFAFAGCRCGSIGKFYRMMASAIIRKPSISTEAQQ